MEMMLKNIASSDRVIEACLCIWHDTVTTVSCSVLSVSLLDKELDHPFVVF